MTDQSLREITIIDSKSKEKTSGEILKKESHQEGFSTMPLQRRISVLVLLALVLWSKQVVSASDDPNYLQRRGACETLDPTRGQEEDCFESNKKDTTTESLEQEHTSDPLFLPWNPIYRIPESFWSVGDRTATMPCCVSKWIKYSSHATMNDPCDVCTNCNAKSLYHNKPIP